MRTCDPSESHVSLRDIALALVIAIGAIIASDLWFLL
jgi:hypothetical protein